MDKMKKRALLLTLLLLGCTFLMHRAAMAEPEAPEELASGNYPKWSAPVQITTASLAPNGARLPVVAAAPNGTIMVGFLRQMSAAEENTDLYYRTSQNNGTTWTPALTSNPLPIHISNGVRSTELDIAYATNNVAHAIWREGERQIHYAKQSDWNSNLSTDLVNNANLIVSGPRIIASQNNRLNVVWAENNNGQYSLRFKRSTDGGNSWPVISQLIRSDIAQRPTMVVVNNTVHLIWEEGIFAPKLFGAKIYYARGTVNEGANQVVWEGPIVISPLGTPVVNAKQPALSLSGSTLHVTFTDRQSDNEQYVSYLRCSANCLTTTNWQSFGNVSGQFIGVHANDPYDMISSIEVVNGCTLAYFHGVITKANEQILGTSSCGGWAQSAQDMVTDYVNRAINPRMAERNGWFVYLVFQEIVVVEQGPGNPPVFLPPQIHFVRNDPKLYLPVIRKP